MSAVDDPDDIRFWSKVDACGDCWEWTGLRVRNGYGQFSTGNLTVLAHRFSFETLVGVIPPGRQLDHLCRNRQCVNPDHLEVVTASVNRRRSALAGNPGSCVNGHLMTFDNVYVNPDGRESCRVCRLKHLRRFQARQRLERLVAS